MTSKQVSAKHDRPYTQFVTYIQQRAEVQGDFDADELTAEAADRILTAETEEDLFAAMKVAGLTGLQYLDNGTVIRIEGFKFLKGNLGVGAYAAIDAVDVSTGERLALDTGIPRVLAFLRQAENMGLLPVTVQVQKKATGSGNELVTLGKAPVHTVRSA